LLHCSNDPVLIANFLREGEEIFLKQKIIAPVKNKSLQLRMDHWSNGAKQKIEIDKIF
jgi:hypothetical protein